MVFQCINIRQVPWEVLKTAASSLGFQHPHGTWRMLMHWKEASVFNTSHGTWRMLMHWKTMFDPYINKPQSGKTYLLTCAPKSDGCANCSEIVRTKTSCIRTWLKSLRKRAYSNILKILPPKKWKFSDKKFWYFSCFCSKHRLWVLF